MMEVLPMETVVKVEVVEGVLIIQTHIVELMAQEEAQGAVEMFQVTVEMAEAV